MLEKVTFFIFAFIMFMILFFKLIRKKDSIYIYLVALNLVGILIRFVELSNKLEFNFILVSVCYIISVIIPFIIIVLELKKIFIPEMIATAKAKMFLKLGDNEKARKILIKFIEKHPDSCLSHKLLADIYEKEGKLEAAIDEYVLVVDLNKKDYDSYYEIALLLNRTEKSEEAQKMLESLLEKKPEYYKASELLGEILYDQDKFKEAATVYLQALKYNPDRFELYYGLGMAYTRLNDFQTAKEYYEKAAKINSMLFHAKVNIAQILLIAGEIEEAEERFIECLENKESEPDAYFYLAIIAMLKGEVDKAVSYVNIAIELDKRMYKRVCRQGIFAPIMDQVRKDKSRNHKYYLTNQEFKTRRYLDETISLINSMKSDGKKRDAKGDGKIIEINEREF
ncbi:MAG: tetratricopeptide repeat protein [Clostridia bacterium]|nr:tetratricopeptide repeat protein [Clostridia bacterium]